MNWNVFQTELFEQQCLLLNILLKQGGLAPYCSSIVLNNADFNSKWLSNAKSLFSETLSPKKHDHVSFDKEGYHDAVLVLFTATPPNITTDIHTGEQISYPLSIKRKAFDAKLGSSFHIFYQKIPISRIFW